MPREYFARPSGEVILWVSFEKWIPAELVDSAPGGIAVAVKTDWQFQLEFQVRVETKEDKRMADVTSVNEMDDGRVRVGLKWTDKGKKK